MLTRLTLGAAVIVGAAVLTPVSAVPLSPQSGLPNALAADGSLVAEVRRRGGRHGGRHHGGRHFRGGGHHFHGGGHFRRWHHGRRHHRGHRHWHGVPYFYFGSRRGSCSYWRHRCAYWHGWGTRSYHYCVWRHGC